MFLKTAIAVVVVRVWSALTDKPVNVSPPEARLNAPVFTTVALPVVFTVKLGVVVAILPIFPEPDANDIELEPVTLPPVCVIVPEPLAVIVSTVPDALPPNTIPPLVPVESRASVPAAVIVPDVVNAPAPPAESVKLILLPVDIPFPVVA